MYWNCNSDRAASAALPTLRTAAAVAAFVIAAPAFAQDESTDSNDVIAAKNGGGVPSRTGVPATIRDHVILGAGVAAVPTYQGSSETRIIPIPIIDVAKGRFFANLPNGVGVNLLQSAVLDAGISAVFVPGYRQRDVPEGVAKLSSGAGVRGFATLHTAGLVANAGITKVLAGATKGLIVDAAVSYPLIMSPRLTLVPTVSTSWADARHNDRYYGITRQESALSGLSPSAPGAGFKDVGLAGTGIYRLSTRINLTANVSYTRSVDDVAESPLVERKGRISGFLGLAFRL